MKLIKKERGGATVVQVEGNLIGGPDNSEKFHKFFNGLLASGERKIVIDLHKTPWANSQGIGMLMTEKAKAEKAGGEMVLANVMKRIKDVLTVTRLLIIFKDFESVDDAADYLGREMAANA